MLSIFFKFLGMYHEDIFIERYEHILLKNLDSYLKCGVGSSLSGKKEKLTARKLNLFKSKITEFSFLGYISPKDVLVLSKQTKLTSAEIDVHIVGNMDRGSNSFKRLKRFYSDMELVIKRDFENFLKENYDCKI